MNAFGIDEFTVLECDTSGHCLIKSAEQDINGEAAVERKGSLYLCETFATVGVCSCV